MPQKMSRNATRNISAPTGNTAATKMPSPSASAHSPTQRHGPPPGGGPGGCGPKPGYIALPPSFSASACSILYKTDAFVPAPPRQSAKVFSDALEILDIFSSSCNIKTTSLYRGSASFSPALHASERTAHPHARNEQKKSAFYRLRHPPYDARESGLRCHQPGAGLPGL